jgi:NADH-quinone oxidoreductase subunit L
MLEFAWVPTWLCAASFVVILFFGKRMPYRGSEVGIGAMAISTVLSLWMTVEWVRGSRVPQVTEWDWFTFGATQIRAGIWVDGLSVMMLVVVSVISLLVQIYSTNYMKHDRRFTHFYAILTFFTAAMMQFVLSSNTLQMVFGWEVMALCSFLLIGHWWEEKRNVHAAMKAFLTTRASDAGLFIGVAILFFAAGSSFGIQDLNERVLAGQISDGLLLAGAVALFVAVIGKSAQFPLHTWLPDAMAGPTPMSALIHAATMVVAGVFLMARLYPVFTEAFNIGPFAGDVHGLNPVALIGGITIVIAAALAFVQTDIKKVLSYSTVSQLGFMVMALGVGAWTSAVFHLFTHAFFKALLFLASGSVSHAVHGFDIEKDMGGLRKTMPITHATFLTGTAAIIGVIPLSGFWSKEQILAEAGAHGYTAFQVVGLVGTFLTAAYMVRCYYLMFHGERRGPSHAHEAPLVFTVPCIILAVLAAGVGFLQAPALGINLFDEWVTPAYLGSGEDKASILVPFVIELAITAAGITLAVLAFLLGFGPRSLAARFSGARAVYHLLYNRLYLDWLYERVFVQGIRRSLAWVVHWVDHNVVDGFVDLVGTSAVKLGHFVDRRIDRQIVDGAVNDTTAVTEGAGVVLSALQNGRVQRYGAIMVGGVALLAIALVVTAQ